jgi:hypothetical protein
MSEPGGAREAPTVVLRGGTPRPDGELAAGDRIGDRYTMVRRLGAGGMGTVYEARDHELGVSVAVKIVRAPDDEAMRRFKREIQLAREVTHPNVCRIYDLGVDDQGEPAFLTMELLDGPSGAPAPRADDRAEARPVLADLRRAGRRPCRRRGPPRSQERQRDAGRALRHGPRPANHSGVP